MTDCPDFDAIAAYLDGEGTERVAEIKRHLAACEACKAMAAEIKLIDIAVRANATSTTAPDRLVDWIDERQSPKPRTLSRRRALGGFAIAAGIAAVAFFLNRQSEPNLAMDTTLFKDFATLIAADGPLDFEDEDPETVIAWFKPRVPFKLPEMASLTEAELRGGRLCWILDRRWAALQLGNKADSACLYVAKADGLTLDAGAPLQADPAVLQEGGLTGAFWRSGDLAFGLVGDWSRQRLQQVAQVLSTEA